MQGKGKGGGQRALSEAVGGKSPAASVNPESKSRKRHKLDSEVECTAKPHEKLNKKQKSIGGFTSVETEDFVLWSPSSRLVLPLNLLQGVDARKPQMTIPRIGFGTYRLKKNAVTEPLEKALTAGYTMLDTASVYDNEKEIGQLLSQRPEAPFVVTKLWRSHQGDPDTVRKYVKTSLRKLKLGRPLDMLIMHWPGPGQHRFKRYQVPQNWTPATRLQTWRTLCGLINEPNATIRSIGVSNFSTRHLQEIIDNGEEIPAINQIEMHPFLIQKEMRTFCQLHSIIVMAYGSLGGTNRELLEHPVVIGIAKECQKSCAQILLRWAVQHDAIIIPCSSSEAHIQDNLDIFGFELSTQQMDRLDALDCGRRWGWKGVNPDTVP